MRAAVRTVRGGYATTVETSVYVDPARTGPPGSAHRCTGRCSTALREEDLHRALAGIALPNSGLGRAPPRFAVRARSGMFTEQGRKFGRYRDVGLVRAGAPLTHEMAPVSRRHPLSVARVGFEPTTSGL